MKIISHKDARKDFFKIAKEVNERSIPVMAVGQDSTDDVVILGLADYNSLLELCMYTAFREWQKSYTVLKKREGYRSLP